MPPLVALSTAGAVAAFAVGVARQVLSLVSGRRPGDPDHAPAKA
jgi:hypothetical protein